MLHHVRTKGRENAMCHCCSFLALARTIQAKKRRTKNGGKPRPPRDLLQKKM